MKESEMKESETLELKKSTSELKEAIISIAAILNKHQKKLDKFATLVFLRIVTGTCFKWE